MTVIWLEEAAAEFDRMLAFLAQQNAMMAQNVVSRVLKATDTIERYPRVGNYDAETDTYDRYVPRTRVVLTYAIRRDDIVIVSTWHTSRDPEDKPRRWV